MENNLKIIKSDFRLIFYLFSKKTSLSQVAEILGIHASTVAKAIDQCEGYYNRKITRKPGRNLLLTQFGEELARGLEPVFHSLVRMEDRLRQQEAREKISVKIATQSAILDAWMADCISDIVKKFPDVTISLVENISVPGIDLKDVDLFVGYGREAIKREDLTVRHIYQAPISFYAPYGGDLVDGVIYSLDTLFRVSKVSFSTDSDFMLTSNGRENCFFLKNYSDTCRVDSFSVRGLADVAVRIKSPFISTYSTAKPFLENGTVFAVAVEEELDPVCVDILFPRSGMDRKIQDVVNHIVAFGKNYSSFLEGHVLDQQAAQ